MSSFYFYEPNGDRIGTLQNDASVQWLENYQAPGEVKIEARVTEQNLAMLVDGMRIYNSDSDTVARICHREIIEGESENTIMVRADLTAELLDDRVLMATENVTNVESAMYSIYRKNRRSLPIEVGSPVGYTERLDSEITWNAVLDAEKTLAEASGLGFAVKFDPETAIETFKVYRGVDRSIEGSDDYVGYFGTDVGNIHNVEITSGTSNYKNVAIVAGAGEGANRIVRTVSPTPVSGENRRELFVDARDLQQEYQVATPTGQYDEKGNPIFSYETKTYTAAQYNAILDARGLEKLAELLKDFAIRCDVDQTNIAYGVDYFLGDRMPIKLLDYGIVASAVVQSVELIYETGNDRRIVVSLDNFRLEA